MRVVMWQVQGLTVVTLLFAAVAGDVTALHRHYLQVNDDDILVAIMMVTDAAKAGAGHVALRLRRPDGSSPRCC